MPSHLTKGSEPFRIPGPSRLSGMSADQYSPQNISSRLYPLQLDTDLQSASSSSPTSPTLVDPTISPSTRRSSESSRTIPMRAPGPQRQRSLKDRSVSISAAPSTLRAVLDSTRPSRQPQHEGRSSPTSARNPTRRMPIVYPAMLSRVAEAFRERIPIADRLKDGLTYKDAFDGREAVDKIAYIIKTTDRNLALLLGRALDAQKFFHDVTYDHRLRDSANELYQFRTKLPSPFVSGELRNDELVNDNAQPDLEDKGSSRPGQKHSSMDAVSFRPYTVSDMDNPDKDDSSLASPIPSARPRRASIIVDDLPLPSGVFTLLTDCYSPTCSRDQLCYSIACPRRLEQQARLNMKPQPGLRKQISRESLGDVVVSHRSTPDTNVPLMTLAVIYRNLGHYGSIRCHRRLLIVCLIPRRSDRKPLTKLSTLSGTSYATWNIFATCVVP